MGRNDVELPTVCVGNSTSFRRERWHHRPMAGDPRTAATPSEYLERLEGRRREEVQELDAMIREELPGLHPYVRDGMLAYGAYRYTYASGRSGDAAVIALAGHGPRLSLYLMCTVGEGYLAEAFAERLPRADVGRSCVRLRRLEHADPEVLRDLLRDAGRNLPEGTFDPSSHQPS